MGREREGYPERDPKKMEDGGPGTERRSVVVGWVALGRHGQAPSGAASLSAEKNLDTKKARVVKTPVSLAPARARASHQSTVKNLQFKSIFLFFHVFFFLLL